MPFDFGELTVISDDEWDALRGYGLDLMEHSMFALPFETVAYFTSVNGGPEIQVAQIIGNTLSVLFVSLDENKHTYAAFIGT